LTGRGGNFLFEGYDYVDYVIYSYMLIWAVFFGYVFLLGRRITKLEQDLASFKK